MIPVRAVLTSVGGLVLGAMVLTVGLSGSANSEDRAEVALAIWSGYSDAASRRAEQFLEQGDLTQASRLAVRALDISSQDSRALRVLQRVAERRGEQDIALSVTALTARLGWRDGFALRTLLDRALAENDPATASFAGDAMLRINFSTDAATRGLRSLIATPEGRAALAERLSAQPRWANDFLKGWLPGDDASVDAFGLFLIELTTRGVRADDGVKPYFDALIGAGRDEKAIALWHQLDKRNVGDPRGGIVDGEFDNFANGTGWGPFGWKPRNDSTIDAKPGSRSEFSTQPALRVDTEGAKPREAIGQLLALRSGPHVLSFDSRLLPDQPGVFRWELRCLSNPRRLLRADAALTADWARSQVSFVIPANGCKGQRLILLAGASRGSASAMLDRVTIDR